MINICVVRHKGYIKANMHVPYQHNHRKSENSSNKNIQKSLSKLNTYLVNNLQDRETFMKAFYRLHDNGLFKGQLKIQGDADKQTKFLDEFLVYPPYQKITEMSNEEQDIFFKKYLDALHAYFPDIIILSAVIHRDEVFIPIDDELKELYPEGKMTPHMHVTAIPIVHDKRTDSKKISISELWKGKNSYRKFQDYMYNSVSKEYGFDRGEIHDYGEGARHLEVEAFKLQEASKSLAKLESDIVKKEQEISERAKVIEPEEHITFLNIKKVVEEQKVIHHALKQELKKNSLLQKEKEELLASLIAKDNIIFNQANAIQNQQEKLSETEKQLSDEKERTNEILNLKVSQALTRKRFNDIKSVMNGIIYYAIENEIVEHNHLKDINYREFAYRPESHNKLPYSEKEQKLVMNHLTDDLYSLATKLDFCMILRIGELKDLRWDDIKGDYIYVHAFMNDKNEILPYCKGHTEAGMRFLPLTKACKQILKEVKLINPDSEYLFIKDSRPLATGTFNRRIKKCCKELGIEYRSSHKVLFSTASIMHKNGATNTELQEMLGHTTLTMTNGYLKNVTPCSETYDKINLILD